MLSSMRSGAVWKQIRHEFGLGTLSGLSEWELLRRYSERRDDAAFAALVARHGAMVVGGCRRLLDDPEDVEDAFQAVFLVLARRSHVLRPRAALGPWLHGVAYRVSLRARAQAMRRRTRERGVAWHEDSALAEEAAVSSCHLDDLTKVLDEEIERLPASYRVVMVLCYLEGRTHDQAAAQLCWPVGTVKGRLARARELLRGRIARRGLAPTLVALDAIGARDAEAMIPDPWLQTTVEAASQIMAGGAMTGLVSANAVFLAEETLSSLIRIQLRSALAVLVAVAVSAAGAGVYSQRKGKDAQAPERVPPALARNQAEVRVAQAPKTESKPKEVVVGPPRDVAIPDNPAFARGFQLAFKAFREGNVDIETVHVWSRRLAEGDFASVDAGRRAKAWEKHLERMEQLQQVAKDRNERRPSELSLLQRLTAQYYRDEAEILANAPTAEAAGAGPARSQDLVPPIQAKDQLPAAPNAWEEPVNPDYS